MDNMWTTHTIDRNQPLPTSSMNHQLPVTSQQSVASWVPSLFMQEYWWFNLVHDTCLSQQLPWAQEGSDLCPKDTVCSSPPWTAWLYDLPDTNYDHDYSTRCEFPPVEQTLCPIKNHLVILIPFMPLLTQWLYLWCH